MDPLLRIAARVAAEYDFRTKAKINALVITEVGRLSGVEDLNAVSEGLLDSPVHQSIQALAEAVKDAAESLGKGFSPETG